MSFGTLTISLSLALRVNHDQPKTSLRRNLRFRRPHCPLSKNPQQKEETSPHPLRHPPGGGLRRGRRGRSKTQKPKVRQQQHPSFSLPPIPRDHQARVQLHILLRTLLLRSGFRTQRHSQSNLSP